MRSAKSSCMESPATRHILTRHILANLANFLGADLPQYKEAYVFLIRHKSSVDYGGIEISATIARQIQRRAQKLKEIALTLL